MAPNTLTLVPDPAPVPLYTQAFSVLAALWTQLITDNPLAWSYLYGRAHARADMTGPVYVFGAPHVNFAPGKAVLGATEDLKNSPVFLFSGKVLGPNGEPLEATLDLWQANTTGGYGYASYHNRGKVVTDPSTGGFEVLTVPPGAYAGRAAHIHGIISAPGYQPLVTQFYLCPNNDPKSIHADWLGYLRAGRTDNMLRCWSIPTSKGDAYGGWPQLEKSNAETIKVVEEWNGRLADRTEGLKITCGASDVIALNKA